MIVMECELNMSQQAPGEDETMNDKDPFWLVRFVGFFMWMLVLFSVAVVIMTFFIGVISYIVDPTFGKTIWQQKMVHAMR